MTPPTNLSELEDNELIAVVQQQYRAYREGGTWECECGHRVLNSRMTRNTNKVLLKIKCPKCKEPVEKFLPKHSYDFDSVEFNELLSRYNEKIYNCCYKFRHIADPDDTYGDMLHRFFLSVITYGTGSKFSTYMWSNIRRRFEDFERKSSRACKNTTVQCQLCGRHVGAITRIHLMNLTTKPKPGFPGHEILHERIIDEYGTMKFFALDDINEAAEENDKYSRKQTKALKSLMVDTYREMFPRHPVSIGHIYLHDTDPETGIEYGEMIADVSSNDVHTDGYFILKDGFVIPESEAKDADVASNIQMFVPRAVSMEEADLCKEFSMLIAEALHKKFAKNSKRRAFKNTTDKAGLQSFLTSIFPFVVKGYDVTELNSIFGYDVSELKFWLKNIKKTPEVREIFNLTS